MGLRSKVKSIFSKKKEEKVTVTETPLETKPSITAVDVGRETPQGFQRTGGYTVSGRIAGGSGGTIIRGSESGEVTPETARALEGYPDITVKQEAPIVRQITPKTPPPSILREAQQRQALQRQTSRDFRIRKVEQEVRADPYITRKEPKVTGYTKSGKPIYEEGDIVVVDPNAEQFGRERERAPTAEERAQLTFIEKERGIRTTPQIQYNAEDYFSYGDLFKGGNFPAVIRRAAYDVGGYTSAIGTKAIEKLGIKTPVPVSANLRAVIGEGVLFTAFSPVMTTATQRAVKWAAPTEVKITGVSQRVSKGVVKTDVSFEATRGAKTLTQKNSVIAKILGRDIKLGGTTFKGTATGESSVIPFKVAGKKYYFLGGKTTGSASQRVLTLRGLRATNQRVFVTNEIGLGQYKNRLLTTGTRGFGGVSEVTKTRVGFKSYGFEYRTGNVQITTAKKISITAGGTISSLGTAKSVGVIFPVKQTRINFLPFAKRGQLLIKPLSTSVKPLSLSITKQASLEITKSGVQAFATTIPATAVTSQVAAVSSLKNLYPEKAEFSLSPKYRVVQPQRQYERVDYGTGSKIDTITGTRSRATTIQTQVIDTRITTKQKELPKQITQQKQITRLIVPRPSFSIPRTPIKQVPILPRFFTGRTQRKGRGLFRVSVRRFGKFKPVGITRTEKEAFRLGVFKTTTTLGATFKVEGAKQPRQIAGYKTKVTKQGVLFIEQPRFRLSTPTETKEIQFYKLKGGRL